MRLIGKIFLTFILLIIITVVLGLGYLGFIPGLSTLFGSDKPRDLGVTYTETDKSDARAKSQIEYVEMSAASANTAGFELIGSRPVTAEFTSAQVTALMNNRPWKYWPYKNVQLKFNADGSAEISGIFDKSKLSGYGAKIGAPPEALEFVSKFLPSNPVFYVKMKASLVDNKVAIFEPQSFQIGRASLPVSMFLSMAPSLIKDAYAIDIGGMAGELSKVENKRALIINYINQRLALMSGFFAKSASFAENKLIFDGTLPEKESTIR